MVFKSLMPFGRSTSLSRQDGENDPFDSLRKEMDRIFDDFSRGWGLESSFETNGFISPKVDVAETDQGLEVIAELPGIDQENIHLDLADDVLTLKAEHTQEKEEKDENKRYYLSERRAGTFLRRFALPFEVDQDKVSASFDKGVLKVIVPRSETARSKAKKIEIGAN